MKILLLSGSFHRNSRSLMILESVGAYLTPHDCVLPALDRLPFYSCDLVDDIPESVADLMAEVAACDGIVVCSPEYNHSVPGVLKNAIDWLSRPAFNSVLKDKPVAIITQADSPVGGARAQAHLKLIFDSTLSVLLPHHEMMIASVGQVVDAERGVHEAGTRQRLTAYLDAFVRLADKGAKPG